MQRSNSDSWDSDGNLIVPQYGIRIAMAVGLLAAGTFCLFTFFADREWSQNHPESLPTRPDPAWLVISWIALPLVPFLLSLLFLSRRSEGSKAAGAGLAAALSGCGIFAAIAAVFGSFLRLFPDPYGRQELLSIVAFLGCCGWTLVAAFRIAAKASWSIFFVAAAATLGFMVMGGHWLSNAESDLDRQYEQRKREASGELFNPLDSGQHFLCQATEESACETTS